MRTSDFDYNLPRELIATKPADRRDESRLMVLNTNAPAPEQWHFSDLPQFMRAGDLLVMNDSRVMKARLRGTRRTTGATVEALLLEQVSLSGEQNLAAGTHSAWIGMCRPARKFHVGEMIDFADGALPALVAQEGPDGERTLIFQSPDILPLLEAHGEIPLPPYIVQRRKETGEAAGVDDAVRYQTVYSSNVGSVAAPTAGLHFTPELLQQLEDQGVETAHVTLHVGAGTFKPVEVENPEEHPMHSEAYEVPQSTAAAIKASRARGGRVVAVGTTTVRTLEAAWDSAAGEFRPGRQSTRLLILPGYEFQVVDAMITNFHLPKSSLLMMVSAFAGHERIMAAYRTAIDQGYRFYSYGDAMLLFK
jgi:S-adenosylmethionine:tRNA ribosyltransferase-isomerase